MAAVAAVVSIVAHNEHLPRRYRLRRQVVALASSCRQDPGIEVFGESRVRQTFAIDKNDLVTHFDALTGDGDAAFDEDPFGILW